MFQPIGGMDRIPYGFARALPPDIIHYDSPVTEITTGDSSVTIAYTQSGTPKTFTADFCICTMPISVLAQTKNNFSPETRRPLPACHHRSLQDRLGVPTLLGERKQHLRRHLLPQQRHGQPRLVPHRQALLPYRRPRRRLRLRASRHRRHDPERPPSNFKPTPFGALPTIQAKLDASRAAVEKLHPGRSHLLTKPIYVSWAKIPYSSAASPTSTCPAPSPPTPNSKNPRAEPTSPETTSRTS